MLKKLRHKLVTYLTRNYLKAITEEDIIQVSSNGWLLKRRKLSSDEIIALKEEAAFIQKSILWRLMKKDVAFLASQQMFDKATSHEDILFGKAMLYNLNLLDEYLLNIIKNK